jgi:acetyl-CoA carboxylase carboxyl transferase subunit alpha
MKQTFLDFEKPIAEIEARIDVLRLAAEAAVGSASAPASDAAADAPAADTPQDIAAEIATLKKQSAAATRDVYAQLTPWQISQVSRHPQRPYSRDYIERIFTDFHELHGDRTYADDAAIIGGLARFDDTPCVVIGHQKGRDTREKILRNFGMPRPEGYRKALRLMRLAERFELPVFTFIDTPGAYPGVGAEERGQSEAIGRNLFEMARLRVPIVCTVIGEGGSGGALAISVGDTLLMLEYATYSVISPEGGASILWKSADKAADAAAVLGITASRLKMLGLIDKILSEPAGGAHRDPDQMMQSTKRALAEALKGLIGKPIDQLLERRFDRLMSYGKYREAEAG